MKEARSIKEMHKYIILLSAIWVGVNGVPARSDVFPVGDIKATKVEWQGYDKYDFSYDGRNCYLVVPKVCAPGKPWVWRARFFGHEPQVDRALLARGFHLAYMDVAELFGSDKAVGHWNRFYDFMTEKVGLAPKVVLEGMSRGGLIVLRWAEANPEKVACIYVDAPVCDFKSWPGGMGKGRGSPANWQKCLAIYGLTEEQAKEYKGNPVDMMGNLARAGVEILSVCGGADKAVPFEENTLILQRRYRELGGKIEVIVKEGVGHHPHSLKDPKVIVAFIIRNTIGLDNRFVLRGSLQNCRIKFVREKKGRVAFLGGSITYNPGWRDMVCSYLKKKFPDTKFDFINAGIPSTGSTPGAFRLRRDVFKDGPVDLLFVEAAVNDATNGRDGKEQRRAMEGIIRQARQINPQIDIVINYFVDPGKMEDYNQGRTPEVIVNHDKVASYYQVSAINLAEEVTDRINAGEFTWQEDFKDVHPSAFGQKLYFKTMERFLERAWAGKPAENATMIDHPLPKKPLDQFSYDQGHLVNIDRAELIKGWEIVPAWRPKDQKGTRKGFVDVPMLESEGPGAILNLAFEGRAVGIFITAGPDTGIIEYSIDGKPAKRIDPFTVWSQQLHLPWALMLESELSAGRHELILKTTDQKNKDSCGYALRIRDFLVNGREVKN